MQTKVQVGGEEKVAVIRRSGEGGSEGQPPDGSVVVEYEVVSPQQLRLRIDGRMAGVYVVRTQEGTWVWHDGRARLVAPEQGATARKGKRDHGPALVTPPMPATVVRVLVEVGQHVEAKAPLVVVSAMKMETTLRAPHAGTIAAIHTQAGAAVRPGEILVDVTPDPE